MADSASPVQDGEKPVDGMAKGNQIKLPPARKRLPPRKPQFKGETEDLNGNVLETYCSKTYSYVELDSLFDDCQQPVLEKPIKKTANIDEVDIDVYDTELEQFVKDKRKLRLPLKSFYSVISAW